jgi:hypothetical protein
MVVAKAESRVGKWEYHSAAKMAGWMVGQMVLQRADLMVEG